MDKRKIKRILPNSLVRIFKKIMNVGVKKKLKNAYMYDYNRYVKASDTFNSDTSDKLIGKIIRRYHVLEKGLTMPETRLGFGKERVIDIIENCIEYYQKYGANDTQFLHAVDVVLQYEHFHKIKNYTLDNDLIQAIAKIKDLEIITKISEQRIESRENYFKNTHSTFENFAKSRSSVRNFSTEEVPIELIMKSLNLANTAPSACNRQCWRTYVFTKIEQMNQILETQGGNRGFGHLGNKLIVVTSDISMFSNVGERNQVFVDGGIYAMNLLYALHYHKIAACILNCSNTIEKDLKLRKICGIKESEVFVAMILCGFPPDNFKIAISKRYSLKNTNKVIQ